VSAALIVRRQAFQFIFNRLRARLEMNGFAGRNRLLMPKTIGQRRNPRFASITIPLRRRGIVDAPGSLHPAANSDRWTQHNKNESHNRASNDQCAATDRSTALPEVSCRSISELKFSIIAKRRPRSSMMAGAR
jgi:hypothetical protein